jgi:hypothetical protein
VFVAADEAATGEFSVSGAADEVIVTVTGGGMPVEGGAVTVTVVADETVAASVEAGGADGASAGVLAA